MINYHFLNSLDISLINEDTCIIFGGTFDPIHEGHIEDIKRLKNISGTLIIAPTIQNPWKEKNPTDIDHRVNMICLALEEEKISYKKTNTISENGVYILNHPYQYSIELVNFVKQSRNNLLWAIGEDLVKSVKDWKNWETQGIDFIVLPIISGHSSTFIRNKAQEPLSAIKKYIELNSLYLLN